MPEVQLAYLLQSMICVSPACVRALTRIPRVPQAPGVNGGNLWKFQLGGHALAVAEFREFDQAQAVAMWKDVIAKC